jgi:hypothetical protein
LSAMSIAVTWWSPMDFGCPLFGPRRAKEDKNVRIV